MSSDFTMRQGFLWWVPNIVHWTSNPSLLSFCGFSFYQTFWVAGLNCCWLDSTKTIFSRWKNKEMHESHYYCHYRGHQDQDQHFFCQTCSVYVWKLDIAVTNSWSNSTAWQINSFALTWCFLSYVGTLSLLNSLIPK